jgi:hypothetical protein
MKYIVKVILPGQSENRNYPSAEIEMAVKNFNEGLKAPCPGEIEPKHQTSISLDNVSHLIHQLIMVEGSVFAEVSLLETQMGKILIGLIKNKIYPRMVARATARSATGYVADLKIITVDVSASPDNKEPWASSIAV